MTGAIARDGAPTTVVKLMICSTNYHSSPQLAVAQSAETPTGGTRTTLTHLGLRNTRSVIQQSSSNAHAAYNTTRLPFAAARVADDTSSEIVIQLCARMCDVSHREATIVTRKLP